MLAHDTAGNLEMRCRSGLFKCYVGLGDDPNAEAQLQELLTRFRDHEGLVGTVWDMAYECRSMKKWARSRELYEYFMEHWPNDERVMVTQRYIAKAGIKIGDYAGAEAAISKLIADYGGNDEIGYELSELADDYASAGGFDEAAALYGQVVGLWNNSELAVDAQKRLSRMWITAGNYEKADAAAATLKSMFADRAGVAAAVEDVGDAYQIAGSSQKAYELYRWVVENHGGHERAIWAQMKAASAQIRKQDVEKAEIELADLMERFADHDDLGAMVHEVVEEYPNAGLYEEGRGLFTYLIDNWDATPDTMLELQVGVALQSIKLGELAKADAAVAKLIANYNDHPKIAKALFQIGEEHFRKTNYPQTIELLELIGSNYPDHNFPARAEVPYILATCHNRRGEEDTAVEYYKQTIEQYPNSRYAQGAPYRIAMIYCLEKQDPNLAVYWFARQMDLYPQFLPKRTLLQMATTYSKGMGDFAKGAELLEQYVEEYPESRKLWTALSNLAFCYEKLGDKPKAEAVLEQALDVSRNENLASYIRNRINALQEGDGQWDRE
jgi:tetratricopeptide (TPR) repeat protein